MFWKFVIGALKYRRQRLMLAFSALAIAAALATVLFGIYGTLEQRLRSEFRSYGANIAAVPANGNTVPLALAASAERLGAQASPFLVTSAKVGRATIPVVGFVPVKAEPMTAYWHVEGSRQVGTGECLAGELLASRLNLSVGSSVTLQDAPCTVKGIVSTGGAEDQELLVPFETAAALAGTQDAANLIQIRAPGERVDAIRTELARQYPAADVRTNLAVAATESNVVTRLRASFFLLTLLILLITTLCVTTSFSEMVVERSKEIGILKAIGGVERKIAAFFVSEAAGLALAATVTGYVIGLVAAAGIGREVFGGAFRLQLNWAVFGIVAGVMLAVAAVATAIAASRIWNIQPAVILRGE